MKTSNRILLIFFINIFLIPLCIFMCFSAEIRKGKYKIVENKIHSDRYRSGVLKPAHTVKLMASEREVICNVEYGDSVFYSYDAYLKDDSLSVYVSGDTIFISYEGNVPEKIMQQEPIPLKVNLRLPEASSFIVENGRVNILSLDTEHPKTVSAEVKSGGVFNIGGPAIVSGEHHEEEKNMKKPLRLEQLNFSADNGRLELGENVSIRSVQLQVIGKSTVELYPGAAVQEITGSVSDSTAIRANWDLIKKLKH